MHCETYVENTQIVEKCHRIGKPKNVSKNSTSELDQVFGANLKIEKKLCFCRALT